MNSKILQKSIDSRNEQAIKKLVDKEALKEWGKTAQPTLPIYKKQKVVKGSIGWWNFVNLVKQLSP